MDMNLLHKNNFNHPLKNNDYSFYKIAFQRRYYGARYQDPKTSRWLSADPALGEYIPGAPVNDEVRKRNGNLPGMGGVFNTVNLHLYHYAGNNPVKYTDPDGEQVVPATQRPNNLPRINIPPNAHPAGQYVANHGAETQVRADAMEESFAALSNENTLSRFIDTVFLGSKYRKAAASFQFKVFSAFIGIKIQTERLMLNSGEIQPDENGRYSIKDAEGFANSVNATMGLNYSDQSELGPYEGSVIIPKMTTMDALLYLNKEDPSQNLPPPPKPIEN